MTVIHEPTIYVVGPQPIDQSVVSQFLADHDPSWVTGAEVGAELLAEVAGRICYMSFGTAQGRKTNRDYLDNIIESGDGSVIEHAVWDFIITGVPRSFTHELIRHRPARRKSARQAARSVLPNATETKIFVSANARALRHFIELRGAPYADPEIRSVAVKMLDIMQREAPNIFHDFETYDLPDGTG